MADTVMDENQTIKPADIHLITEPEVVKIFFDPLRRQIVQTIVDEPRTVGQIATKLGLDFRKLYYHIKLLEGHGLIQLVDRQLISGAVEEKYYQVSAYRFVIDPTLLTFGAKEHSDALTAFAAFTDDIGRASREELPLFSLQRLIGPLSAEDAEAFRDQLYALIEDFTQRHDSASPDDTEYGFFTGFYRVE